MAPSLPRAVFLSCLALAFADVASDIPRALSNASSDPAGSPSRLDAALELDGSGATDAGRLGALLCGLFALAMARRGGYQPAPVALRRSRDTGVRRIRRR